MMERGDSCVQGQQHRYFYIDRKFGSGNLNEINDALDDLDLFLESITKMDLANSLLVRLTELIPTTKSLLLKYRAADIFSHHSSVVLNLPSRDEIAFSLSRMIKGSDEVTRIVSLQIMNALIGSWCKDISLYHILLGKLSSTAVLSSVQKKESIVCLRKILSSNPSISKNFSKSITELSQIYRIPLSILLYLLSFSMIDSHRQKQLLRELCLLVFSSQRQTTPNKRQIHYLVKIVLQFASSNYRIIQYYESQGLERLLPAIRGQIEMIKQKKFWFLGSKTAEHGTLAQNGDDLIDELFAKKKEGVLQSQYQQYQEALHIILDENQSEGHKMKSVLLLLYFSEDTVPHYDRKFKRHLVNSYVAPTTPLFKQLSVIGCFESASYVLSHIKIQQFNYVFLRAYLEFKSQKEPKKLEDFKAIANVISPLLYSIVSTWQVMDKIVRFVLAESWEQIQPLQKELSDSMVKLSQGWGELTSVIEVFRSMKKGDNIQLLKRKCYCFLPSSIMSMNSYWFAHFNKQSINKLLTLSL